MKKRTGEILELLDEKYGTEFICYLNYDCLLYTSDAADDL